MTEHRGHKSLKILIAEDNPVNSHLAGRMLLRLGYKADLVANGQEVIDLLKVQAYDLIFMDLQMPLVDGIQASRWIQAHPHEIIRSPFIVALTANSHEDDRRRCADAGMIDFLTKPISLEKLRMVLEVLENRRSKEAEKENAGG